MYRELANIAIPKLYSDEFDIQVAIEEGSLTQINESIRAGETVNMMNGKTIIDKQNNRSVIKIDNKLYRQVVNADDEVIYQEIGV
jgi:hypothetical protein